MTPQQFRKFSANGFFAAAFAVVITTLLLPMKADAAVTATRFMPLRESIQTDECEVERDIIGELEAIEGLLVEEIESTTEGYRAFVLGYRQPVDHARPWGESFTQRIVLVHRGFDAPTEFATAGYAIFGQLERRGASFLSQSLQANYLSVEHRYFGESRTETRDWSFLTIEQAAADLHRIVEAIRPLYSEPWFSTGTSKGGMTALYHRRFYPDDVDATVAFVAPNSFGRLDRRYTYFLNRVGSAQCRSRIRAFQKEVLDRRENMVELLGEWSEATGVTFNLVEGGLDQALDIAVGEFYYAFWQYFDESRCSDIPRPSASDDELMQALQDFWTIDIASDFFLEIFQPYFVQAVRQLGYPRLNISHLRSRLEYNPNDYRPYLLGVKRGGFDWLAMVDMYWWVAFEAENIMLIYGENDPWTAGAFNLVRGRDRDAYKYMVADGNHGAWLDDLEDDDHREAISTLEQWTGTEWTEISRRRELSAESLTSRNWRERLSSEELRSRREHILRLRLGDRP